MTLDTACSPLLQKALASQNGILLSASELDQYSSTFNGFPRSRSWLCVPLIASARLIGLLALGHSAAEQFTPEHLRLARSVAIPAAAAIQNARLYECAKIYGVELEKRTTDLQEAQSALQRFQNRNPS
jgi:transcriptional regulator with GAF, ATPase, and Fis domain